MRYYYLVVILLCCWGCSSTKQLRLRQISGEKDIRKGGKATISWQFENADSVKIEGDVSIYKSIDSLLIMPTENTTYKITAYRGKRDSVIQLRTINVDESGDLNKNNGSLQIISPFTLSKTTIQHTISVQQKNYYISDKNTINIELVLSDEKGHAIIDSNLRVTIYSSTTDTLPIFTPLVTIKGIEKSKPSTVIVLDQSLEMEPHQEIINQYLYQAVRENEVMDTLHFIRFNNSILTHQSGIRKKQALDAVNGFQNYKPMGLRCLYNTIQEIISNPIISDKASIVVLTSGPDNGSIISDAESIIQLALHRGITIHVCNINNEASDNYSLKYLSSKSGGSYIDVSSSDTLESVKQLKSLLTIGYGPSYSISIPDSIVKNRESVIIKTIVVDADTSLTIKSIINADENSKFTKYKVLTLFSDSKPILDSIYFPHILTLITILKLNPTKVIEIIGYASLKESRDDAISLALQRASVVRKHLISNGVEPNQIRIRGYSNIKPMYPDESYAYQSTMNRRVEIRWIDPSLLPYEIAAEKVDSEQEALSTITLWENKKCSAYYDRRVANNIPYYQVLLWGYSTKEQMNQAISTFRKTVNYDLIPED